MGIHWPAAWRQSGQRAHSAEVLDVSEQGAFVANAVTYIVPDEGQPVELIIYVGAEHYRIDCHIAWMGMSPHHHVEGFGLAFDPEDAFVCEAMAYQLLMESGDLD